MELALPVCKQQLRDLIAADSAQGLTTILVALGRRGHYGIHWIGTRYRLRRSQENKKAIDAVYNRYLPDYIRGRLTHLIITTRIFHLICLGCYRIIPFYFKASSTMSCPR